MHCPIWICNGRKSTTVRGRGQHGQRHSLARGWPARPGARRWHGQQRPCGTQLRPAGSPAVCPSIPDHGRRRQRGQQSRLGHGSLPSARACDAGRKWRGRRCYTRRCWEQGRSPWEEQQGAALASASREKTERDHGVRTGGDKVQVLLPCPCVRGSGGVCAFGVGCVVCVAFSF